MVKTGPEAAQRWKEELATWAIPELILAQAPEDPWRLPVALFEPTDLASLSPSHRRGLEALRAGDDVLDVGAGRCAMSLPLRPPAGRIIAVDGADEMLHNSPADVTILGRWPEAAEQASRAALVMCGHVLYNVGELAPFVLALDRAATRRVVIEITSSHPRNRPLERELWKHFWGIERPTGPTWEGAIAVMREVGLQPRADHWESEQRGGFPNLEDLVSWMRRTVCLDPSREAEVREIVKSHTVERDGRWQLSGEPRLLTTIWWDTSPH